MKAGTEPTQWVSLTLVSSIYPITEPTLLAAGNISLSDWNIGKGHGPGSPYMEPLSSDGIRTCPSHTAIVGGESAQEKLPTYQPHVFLRP